MKADAIREIIGEFLRLIHERVVVYEDEADDSWRDTASDAKANLTALEAENAEMNRAIKSLCLEVRAEFSIAEHEIRQAIGNTNYEILLVKLAWAEGLLSPPPSGKVPAEREGPYMRLAKAASRACDVMAEALDHGLEIGSADWHEMKKRKDEILASLLKEKR